MRNKVGTNVGEHILRIAIGISILLLLAQGAMAAGETVSLSPTQGPPGTKVDFSGTGWQPSEALDIYMSPNFNKEDILANVVTNTDGSFKTTVVVPQNKAPGKYYIQARTVATHRMAEQEYFTVIPPTQIISTKNPPEIIRYETFREGDMVFFRLFYTDLDNDAEGFGFRGAKGSTWGEETHPFSNPSYGRVSPGQIEYPFNHGCDSGSAYGSDVEAWIYDSMGLVSKSVEIHLACTAPVTQPIIDIPPTPVITPEQVTPTPVITPRFVCLGGIPGPDCVTPTPTPIITPSPVIPIPVVTPKQKTIGELTEEELRILKQYMEAIGKINIEVLCENDYIFRLKNSALCKARN